MAHVVVTIAGRTYRMACDDGQEARLEELARLVETKIFAMREGFGDIGEQRIVVMAAIAIADEAADTRGGIKTLETETAALRADRDAVTQACAAMEQRLTQALDEASLRIERLVEDLLHSDVETGGFP